jgi:hypothetical protein
MLSVIFAPTYLFIGWPWIAGVVAAAFGGWYATRRHRALLAMALLWSTYCLYEYGMKLRILCSGECNIRVDLLLIWPLLAVASAVAAWRAMRRPTGP